MYSNGNVFTTRNKNGFLLAKDGRATATAAATTTATTTTPPSPPPPIALLAGRGPSR